jgi:4-amino-4-deoxy-L-arabinose transferase-like glycosyltransferase
MIRMTLKKMWNKVSLWMRNRKWLLTFLLLGIVIRFVFVALFPDWDSNSYLDSTRYQRVADNLRNHHGFCEWRIPTAFTPPVYPYFIAALNSIFGKKVILVKIIQVFLSILSMIILYWIAKNTFNRVIGIISVFIMAINPEIVAMAGSMYTETLYIFLSVLAFSILFRCMKEPSRYSRWILLALVLGLTILTRHILILFPAMLLIFTFIAPSLKDFRKPMTFFTTLCCLILLPWTLRNYVIFDRFVPVATGTGGGLWHGMMAQNSEYHYEETRKTIAEETKGLETPEDREYFLMQKTFEAIKKNPVDFIRRVFLKFFRFFTQVYEDIPQGMKRKSNPVIILLLSVNYYPILIFCIWGMIVHARRWRQLFPLYGIILYSCMLYSITFVTPRYRIPLLPFMILFACAGLFDLYRRMNDRHIPDLESIQDRRMAD